LKGKDSGSVRYFALLDFQTVMLLTFLGTIAFVLLYLAFAARVSSKKGEAGEEDFPDEIKIRRGPIPRILIFVYAGFIVWAVIYVIVIGLRGGPF
jgi:hypothetical protein